MDPRATQWITVSITAFIPWLISLAALGASSMLPRPLFVIIHYTLVILLFGVAFAWYYAGHKGEDPFSVMGIAILSLLVYEVVYFIFIYEGTLWFLTWVDWIVPLFLIASTIYWVGKIVK